ncbi:MAG: amino acid permease [Nanoarchaeota archaeon]|nr:amino acid permease [Nanoarchaeota archaeon]MBU1104176.1 amino acid permease [Nanoarchaeota archaeon]
MSKTFAAVSTMVGTIIGAGILGIPYVVMRSGFLIGVLNMIVIAAILLLVNLYLGEIGLRTKTNHHLSGYAEKYLGKKGKLLMFFAFAFGVYSALIAYLIGEGESFSYFFFNSTDYSLYFGIAFWFLLSAITYFGLKALEEGEEFGIVVIFLLIISIAIFYANKIDVSNLTYNNPSLFYVPFGVILFAFLGFSAIPEVERILRKDKGLTKRVICISSLVTLIIYIIFTAIVVGSQSQPTPQLATLALGKVFIFFGILTMFTSYLALATALVDTFRFDFKKTKNRAWLYTICLPLPIFLILHFFNKASFIKILGIGGVISGTIVAALILLMIKKAKKLGSRKPEYSVPYSRILAWLIVLILAAGAVLEIWSSF